MLLKWATSCKYFYPRPPRGGRPDFGQFHAPVIYFYPRPPRGGRPHRHHLSKLMQKFLSTPSARRATEWYKSKGGTEAISIHALREEGDY